jgi:heat-inducible transcriptional repressor
MKETTQPTSGQPTSGIDALNVRSRTIFRQIVETYLETGEPVGSRTLAEQGKQTLSPASIRNVMQSLENIGLLRSPHTSAGRLPTQLGLRLFVDGLLEIGNISEDERREIENNLIHKDTSIKDILDEAGTMLSGLSQCASLVYAPKVEAPVDHVEFITISANRILVVLVMTDQTVENRIIEKPDGLTPSAIQEAANFLNAQIRGQTLSEAITQLKAFIASEKQELDGLAKKLVEAGMASWTKNSNEIERLLIRGRANLLDNAHEDLELMRRLFDDLERKKDLIQLLDLARQGDGVRIFIGSENKLFSLSGSSLVISPYMNEKENLIGAIGVIGPTRINYGRIVPIIDYTARLVGKMIAERTQRKDER